MDALTNFKQGDSLPDVFYQEVVRAMAATGFPEAGQDAFAHQTFMDGLRPEIQADTIRGAPQDTADCVRIAMAQWKKHGMMSAITNLNEF